MRRIGTPSLWSRWNPSGEEGTVLMRWTKTEKKQKLGQAKQGLEASSNQEMQAPKQRETSTGNPKRLRSEGSTRTEMARPPKRPRDSSGPGNYKEPLTNIKIAIFKETYPEDKVTEHGQDNILEELGRVLCGTPIGELPHLKSYRLEEGALFYIYITHSLTHGAEPFLRSYQLRSHSRNNPSILWNPQV
jgi:hypothetical protein